MGGTEGGRSDEVREGASTSGGTGRVEEGNERGREGTRQGQSEGKRGMGEGSAGASERATKRGSKRRKGREQGMSEGGKEEGSKGGRETSSDVPGEGHWPVYRTKQRTTRPLPLALWYYK